MGGTRPEARLTPYLSFSGGRQGASSSALSALFDPRCLRLSPPPRKVSPACARPRSDPALLSTRAVAEGLPLRRLRWSEPARSELSPSVCPLCTHPAQANFPVEQQLTRFALFAPRQSIKNGSRGTQLGRHPQRRPLHHPFLLVKLRRRSHRRLHPQRRLLHRPRRAPPLSRPRRQQGPRLPPSRR